MSSLFCVFFMIHICVCNGPLYHLFENVQQLRKLYFRHFSNKWLVHELSISYVNVDRNLNSALLITFKFCTAELTPFTIVCKYLIRFSFGTRSFVPKSKYSKTPIRLSKNIYKKTKETQNVHQCCLITILPSFIKS